MIMDDNVTSAMERQDRNLQELLGAINQLGEVLFPVLIPVYEGDKVASDNVPVEVPTFLPPAVVALNANNEMLGDLIGRLTDITSRIGLSPREDTKAESHIEYQGAV